ncbi:ArfGap-domain-containing protein [Lactarius deliciosus]|nr:ArfGap-domain-containing protein [Lactarius deliciosus]
MSPQDKATTERHARILRELVKRSENRVCADCKHNDPRWASWNLGVFLCIRCSGIHRGMGTHISKVKSIDLDAWTPEQMENIQKWGNRLANLYWEAHLKPGHIPPDHKVESFIRSKYESRRWALEGPPPSDPAALEGSSTTVDVDSKPQSSSLFGPNSAHTDPPHRQLSAPAVTSAVTARQSQPRQLLSAQYARGNATPQATSPAPSPAPPPASAPTSSAPENDLFSLDFHAPPVDPTPTASAQKKDTKQDILSLFSTPAAHSPWAQAPVTQPQSQALPPFSNTTAAPSSTATWNVGHNWNNPVPSVQQNVWGSAAPAQQPSLLGSGSDIWGGTVHNSASPSVGPFGSSTATHTDKKEDVFGDIWGSFK